jgi:hypothetical protein
MLGVGYMNEPIDIRAHHLLCIPRFYGGGYNKEFGDNMRQVCNHIRGNPLTRIRVVVAHTDVICSKCPHVKGEQCAQTLKIAKWVNIQDRTVAKRLGIKDGTVLPARDVFNLSMDNLETKDVKRICAGCSFIDYCVEKGINGSFCKDINRKDRKRK